MNFFLNNFRYKILALIAAFIFWAFVVTAGNPIFKFAEPIAIKPFNLSEQMSVADNLGSANLILRANSEVYKNLKATDFEVYVDLKGLQKGDYETPVSVTSKNSDVTVLDIIPRKIKLTLEQLISKTIPVNLIIEGKPAEGYEKKEGKLDITSIKITGSEGVLHKIQEAKALLKLNKTEKEDVNKSLALKIVDTEGKEVTGNFEITPKEVKIFMPIYSVTQQKTVGIKVNLMNPSNISWVSKISVNPSIITIKGELKDLDKIDYIETEAVDLHDLQLYKSKKVKLIIPEKLQLLQSESQWVTVSAEVEEYQNNQSVSASIKYFNAEPDYQVSLAPENITLEISGKLSDLQQLKPTDYYVSLDLKGVTEDRTVELTSANITLPKGIKLIDFKPKNVEVKMEKRAADLKEVIP